MAHGIKGWRWKLRQTLSGCIGEPVTLGELFSGIKDDIPLHTASRVWLSRYRGKGVRELGNLDQMRWVTFTHELSRLSVHFNPPLCRGRTVLRDTLATAYTYNCTICGQPYIAPDLRATCCGQACGARRGSMANVARKRRLNDQQEARPGSLGAD